MLQCLVLCVCSYCEGFGRRQEGCGPPPRSLQPREEAWKHLLPVPAAIWTEVLLHHFPSGQPQQPELCVLKSACKRLGHVKMCPEIIISGTLYYHNYRLYILKGYTDQPAPRKSH